MMSWRKPLVQLQHIDFLDLALREPLEKKSWLVEKSFTYRWFNRSFKTFDDFLKTFPANRRNKIKREVAAVEREGICFEVLVGEQVSLSVMQTMFQCYNANFQKHYRCNSPLLWPFFA